MIEFFRTTNIRVCFARILFILVPNESMSRTVLYLMIL